MSSGAVADLRPIATRHERASSDRVAHALSVLGPLAQADVPLAPFTTYRVGGRAAVLVRPRRLDDLDLVAAVLAETGLPPLVVGRGSNLLIADGGFDGIAISLSSLETPTVTGPEVTNADAPAAAETSTAMTSGIDHRVDGSIVTARAIASLPQLARRLVAASLSGFEWAVGVPGSIGGAVRMNAGGHGSDMSQCLIDVLLYDLREGCTVRLPADRLGLRFRGSGLAGHQIVIDARLQLAAGDREASQRELDEIVRWRREHQPGGQNAGSVFVNPVPGEVTAGELIERVGLRGFTLGTASVSSKHANFIQSSEGGTSADVVALIELVRRRVADETGFVMRSEVRLIGFPDQSDPDHTDPDHSDTVHSETEIAGVEQ
jgi:UDP-N-acetylmuramate dehydrogenase